MPHIVSTLAVSSFVAWWPDATNAATRSNSTCRASPMPVTIAPTRNESHRRGKGGKQRVSCFEAHRGEAKAAYPLLWPSSGDT